MNGDSAEPSTKTITKLKSKKINIIGTNHHFFRTLKKPQISFSMLTLPIVARSK
jgi:hypothetical protein